MAFAMTCIVSMVAMITSSRGPAADFYPFIIPAIQIYGGSLIVPQFRTMLVTCTTYYLLFWIMIVPGQTSLVPLYASTFVLSVTTFAVIMGSYAREALERDQLRKEQQLARARDDALRMADAAVQANASKNRMLASVSHELRTPMNAIIGFSEVMKAEIFGPIQPERYRGYIDDIHKSGGILLSNIDDLLDMARIEAGKMGWDERTFPIAEAMEMAAKASRSTLRDDTIRIVWRDESGGASINADFDRFCQAMINVLNNAGKFSPPESVIFMNFGRARTGWQLTVSDKGCGIPAEELPRIREPFAQVRQSDYDAAKGGIGLGLAITGEIVRRMKGEILIDSIEGKGTTVTFRLPASRIERRSGRLIA
jgi:two-component system cell cycle sensor histidine kinase PleC